MGDDLRCFVRTDAHTRMRAFVGERRVRLGAFHQPRESLEIDSTRGNTGKVSVHDLGRIQMSQAIESIVSGYVSDRQPRSCEQLTHRRRMLSQLQASLEDQCC